jgi:hypothetical protein
MRASRSVGDGRNACQVVGCQEPASVLPVELELPSGLVLEVAVCPIHTVELPEGFFLLDDLERDELEPETVA